MTKEKQDNTFLPKSIEFVLMVLFLGFFHLERALAFQGEALPLFQEEEVLKITIEAPFTQLIKTSRSGKDAFEGRLILGLADGSKGFAIKVSPRGNSRRTNGFCRFPPLRVNFKKKQVQETLFHGQDKLKLVTHCQKSNRFQELYIKEYTAYKAYNVLTPFSFKVRMVEVTYVDTEGKMSPITKYGFFIEDIEHVGDRVGMEELEIEKIRRSQLEPRGATLYALFQYFIGNLDWSNTQGGPGEECCHNSKLLSSGNAPGVSGIVPIPYDFDFSGLVDAPYATPPDNISAKNVRERLFRGYCLHNGEIESVKNLFLENESQLRAVFAEETLLGDRARKKTLAYIDSFFETLKNPKKSRRVLQGKCLN